ncbi:MAG: polysaccharide deacetylase family protein [Clostridia bacterium]|nr:polysaccharide deacetylase family protein [Clostridia bacterium]
MKRLLAMLICLALLLPCAGAQAAQGLPLQDCHKVTLKQTEQQQQNGAKAVRWTIDTVLDSVDEELNGLTKDYINKLAPKLQKPGSTSNENSRLTVSIRPSRTGLTWMSFMVQARTLYHQQNTALEFTTRTYDMTTGERIMLADVFPADSEAWTIMASAVRDTVNAYYPGSTATAEALERVTTREALEQMDFTLHGMSLVLHLDAKQFYPKKNQLIEVTLFYPDIRPYMTEKAQEETDNLSYYYTVALTIDDGPNGWITDKILQVLMSRGERATFFLVGERIKQQTFLVQREHDEGHSIATHNWQHVYANVTAKSTLQKMPPKVYNAHVEAIGIPVRYARAPGGHWRGMAEAEMGWPLIQWTVEASDWLGDNGPQPTQTAGNIVAGTDDGGIILMHDMKQNSIEAINIFVERLQNKGFIFLTVDELFAKDGVVLQPNTPYWRCTDGVTEK